ncbi:hypothetical protein SLA2020_366470 [Shorea laevis]
MCVCLGEFEIKEELLQIPLCKHVFHVECIHHWLHSNSTCPLCRRLVIIPTKIHSTNPAPPPTISEPFRQKPQQQLPISSRHRMNPRNNNNKKTVLAQMSEIPHKLWSISCLLFQVGISALVIYTPVLKTCRQAHAC